MAQIVMKTCLGVSSPRRFMHGGHILRLSSVDQALDIGNNWDAGEREKGGGPGVWHKAIIHNDPPPSPPLLQLVRLVNYFARPGGVRRHSAC